MASKKRVLLCSASVAGGRFAARRAMKMVRLVAPLALLLTVLVVCPSLAQQCPLNVEISSPSPGATFTLTSTVGVTGTSGPSGYSAINVQVIDSTGTIVQGGSTIAGQNGQWAVNLPPPSNGKWIAGTYTLKAINSCATASQTIIFQ